MSSGPVPTAAGAPRVSVVVPAHRARPFIADAIESVLAQTFDDLEVVVVDDGGDDGVADWVADLASSLVRCVCQDRQGQSAARNRGIRESRGELIALLDADDVWHPTKLEKQVAVLDAFTEVGLVHCGIAYVDRSGRPLGRQLGVTGHGDVWDQIVLPGSSASVRCGSTPLIRRECFDRVGVFDTDLSYSEDWDMWLRIAAEYPFSSVDEPLVDYRQHADSVSTRYHRVVANQTAVLDKAFASHPHAPVRLRRQAYAQSRVFGSWRAWFAGDRRAAQRCLAEAIRLDPTVLARKNTVNLALRVLAGPVHRSA